MYINIHINARHDAFHSSWLVTRIYMQVSNRASQRLQITRNDCIKVSRKTDSNCVGQGKEKTSEKKKKGKRMRACDLFPR